MGALLERTTAPTGDDRSHDDGSPHTVPSLLRVLHRETESALALKSVLRVWLDDHDPSPPLRLSLRANGFGLLLNEYDSEHSHS
jgi:hypothetical protein